MGKGRTKIGRFIHNTWTNLNLRCRNGRYYHLRDVKNSKSYENIDLLITREEFKEFCYKNKHIIEELSRPSIDRIDNKGHYYIENMAIIELSDNVSKDKIKARNGMVECCYCKIVKPLEEMRRDNRTKNGRSTCCTDCNAKVNKIWREKVKKETGA